MAIYNNVFSFHQQLPELTGLENEELVMAVIIHAYSVSPKADIISFHYTKKNTLILFLLV